MARLTPLVAALALATASGPLAAADLLEAYERARLSDPQLAAAESRRLAQGENVVQSRSVLLPQINGEASLSDSDGDRTSLEAVPSEDGSVTFGPAEGSSDTRTRRYGVSLTQTIYDHSDYTALRASKARDAQARADLDAALDGLMIRVSEAYFTVLTAIDTLVFARAEERAVGRQLDQADQRFEVGLTAITDVHEARARYDASRANAIAAENSLNDAREALAEITGEYLSGIQGLGDEFQPLLPEPNDIGLWVETALAENPLILSREYAVQAAEHDIGTARSGHLPTLSASVSWSDSATWGNSRSNDFEFPATSTSDGTTVGLTLRVPIFSGFATSSRVKQSVYNRDATADQLEQERRAVTRQTRNAYRALLAGISEVAARQQALVSAQSALEATEAGFEVGTRTIVDVLLQQQVLFQAQRDYSNARHNFLVNSLRLKQAAGVIALGDIEDVNRLLVRNAEAALDAVEDDAEGDDADELPPGVDLDSEDAPQG